MSEKESLLNKQNSGLLIFKDHIDLEFLSLMRLKAIEKIGLYLIHPDDESSSKDFDGTNFLDVSLCKHIIGVHKSKTLFLNKDEIEKKQNDKNYRNQLLKEIYDDIYLSEYAETFFRHSNFIDYSRCPNKDYFLYFPLSYDLFAISIRAMELLSPKMPLYDLFMNIFNKSISVLTLMEVSLFESAYALTRGIADAYVKLFVLKDHPEAFEAYQKFVKLQIYKTYDHQEFPDEFEKMFKKRKNKNASKTAYLNYGWLDNVDGYNDSFSISGIFEYLKSQIRDAKSVQWYNEMRLLYDKCHGYTHSVYGTDLYPLDHYLHLTEMLQLYVPNTYLLLCETLGVSTNIKGIDIYKKIAKDSKEFYKKTEKGVLNEESIIAYYNQK